MTIETAVPIYEVSGEPVSPLTILLVRSHWNEKDCVVLVERDGTEVKVRARDLRKAIENATDW